MHGLLLLTLFSLTRILILMWLQGTTFGGMTKVVFRRSLVRKLTIDGNELRRLALR